MKSFSCLLIGEQSLLVQCGEQWLASGHRIVAVVAANDSIKAWCSGHSILQFNDLVSLEESEFLQQVQPDYLFSITNLKILPLELLKVPSQMAINFHDGPLPAYAGLNAPVWALMNGEPEHGVTFHQMAPEVDLGDILVQRKFPVVEGDTTFTLNGRCYQEGLEAFTDLIELLGHRSAMSIAQNHSQRSYYAAKKRPTAAACIDWQQAAIKIQRFVRALDFGSYLNPLLLPKIWLGLDGFIVREVHFKEIDQIRSSNLQQPVAAGTVLDIDENSITVSALDAALEFSRVSSFTGVAISPLAACSKAGIELGSVLPAMDPGTKADIDTFVEHICLYESLWSDRLQKAEPVATPFAQLSADLARADNDPWEVIDYELPEWVVPHVAIAALAMLFARLSGKSQFTLAFQNSATVTVSPKVASLLETWLPLPVNYEPELTFKSFCAAIQKSIPAREMASGFLNDLYARDPHLDAGKSVALYPIKIRLLDTENRADDFAAIYQGEMEGQNSLLIDIPANGNKLQFRYCPQALSSNDASKIGDLLLQLLGQLQQNTDLAIGKYPMLVEEDKKKISSWNDTAFSYDRNQCIHQLIEQQVERSPEVIACRFENQQVSFQQLNERANQLARLLVDEGVGVGDLVGILLNRSINMLVALIAVHKAGAAYVPLDPVYPRARLQYMVEDSGLKILLQEEATDGIAVSRNAKAPCIEQQAARLASYPANNLNQVVGADELAYVIYTSGSTGKPKGVMVEHRNVVNFFVGMDQRIEPGPGTWLAVTSISFDISVLELFWTLARGFTVLLYADAIRQKMVSKPIALGVAGSQKPSQAGKAFHSEAASHALEFGLFYWNVATEESQYDNDKYKLLIDSACYADEHGFNAVWTPERHFASFGGLFPNPSVTSAALATITKHVALRAGSCVVPLHSPIRIAEEWSVVDNLSHGRVGISIASGWAPPDFAIKPESFEDAKNIMFESAQKVQQLWRGETLEFPGPNGNIKVQTLPRPIQKELPLWVTTAGNIDSFKRAGEIGANVLTHLLGQTIEEVAEKVVAYRHAWQKAGHGGRGVITVMLHTFAGPDQQQVEELVREPMKNYLKSAMFLVKSAAWQFPAFKQLSEEQGKTLDSFFETISEQDMDDLLEFAFQRYFSSSGLFGTPEHCQQIVDQVYKADCDEIACLIDFGVDTEIVLEHLPYLNQVRELAQGRLPARAAQSASLQSAPLENTTQQSDFSLQALLKYNDVTHLQCTPSMATMLAADDGVRPGLARLKQMMVGGEAFPPALAKELSALVQGRVSNMYGPTEATIWSSCGDIDADNCASVSIGRALANQCIYILDEHQQPLPLGIAGELAIGGEGVVRGYLNRPELTQQRFLNDPFSAKKVARMYRTGDLARYRDDGELECLGRVDSQVKIRGYRIELGEIESLLRDEESVAEVAVLLREDVPGDQRLVAYIRAHQLGQLPINELKVALARQLPDFMVPSHFVQLQSLPLTPNGKVDRNALPKPGAVRKMATSASASQPKAQGTGVVQPASEIESLVLSIWKQALALDEIASDANFFDIGGHSLLVIQVLKELRERTGQRIQMTDLFRYTTVSALATFLGADTEKADTKRSNRASARKARRSRRP